MSDDINKTNKQTENEKEIEKMKKVVSLIPVMYVLTFLVGVVHTIALAITYSTFSVRWLFIPIIILGLGIFFSASLKEQSMEKALGEFKILRIISLVMILYIVYSLIVLIKIMSNIRGDMSILFTNII